MNITIINPPRRILPVSMRTRSRAREQREWRLAPSLLRDPVPLMIGQEVTLDRTRTHGRAGWGLVGDLDQVDQLEGNPFEPVLFVVPGCVVPEPLCEARHSLAALAIDDCNAHLVISRNTMDFALCTQFVFTTMDGQDVHFELLPRTRAGVEPHFPHMRFIQRRYWLHPRGLPEPVWCDTRRYCYVSHEDFISLFPSDH